MSSMSGRDQAVVVGVLAAIGGAAVLLGRSSGPPGPPPPGGFIVVPPSTLFQPPTPPSDAIAITEFGADPTGSGNAWTALNSAILAAQQHAGSHTVYVPEGVFSVTAPPTPRVVWLGVDGTIPVRILGAGRDKTRIVGSNKVNGGVLLGIHVNGSSVEHLTVDTAFHNGGIALAIGADHCHWQSIGACVGQTFGLRFVKGGGAKGPHGVGNSADDVYLDGGNQPQPGAGTAGAVGWTADWDIDYQDSFKVTNVVHRGGYLAVYWDGQPGGNPALASIIDGYDYTPTSRASSKIWHGIHNARSSDVTFRRVTIHGDPQWPETGLAASSTAPKNPATDGNTNLVYDQVHIAHGKLQLGDVLGLRVTDSVLDRLVMDPTYALAGTFARTTAASIQRSPAPGATINVTGI